jgi:hypothetical protein
MQSDALMVRGGHQAESVHRGDGAHLGVKIGERG